MGEMKMLEDIVEGTVETVEATTKVAAVILGIPFKLLGKILGG